jgi:electron transport complex protein RnfG
MAARDGSWLGTVLVAALAVVAAVAAMDAAYQWSRGRVAAHERAAIVARLDSVLDPALRSRDVTTARLTLEGDPLLGSAAPLDAFVMEDDRAPVATVLTVVAPLGYNGPIQLLVGISPQGVVTGIRAVRHRETAGLGDAIDASKSDWTLQFDARALVAPERERWAVRQDEGDFDAIAGATVTSRAVVSAVKNALLYFEQHRDALYAAAAVEPDDDDDRTD